KWCSTRNVDLKPSASASTLVSSQSRKPWPVSGPKAPLSACAEPKRPNFIGVDPAARSEPRKVRERDPARVHVHAAELGAAVQRRKHLAGIEQALLVEGAFEPLLLV